MGTDPSNGSLSVLPPFTLHISTFGNLCSPFAEDTLFNLEYVVILTQNFGNYYVEKFSGFFLVPFTEGARHSLRIFSIYKRHWEIKNMQHMYISDKNILFTRTRGVLVSVFLLVCFYRWTKVLKSSIQLRVWTVTHKRML